MKETVRKDILKCLDNGIIYPISDSSWVSLMQLVLKKLGITLVNNDVDKLIPTRIQTGWRVCIDYRKLNSETRKDHFPLPFIDQMLERLAGHEYYCFLDGYSSYNQILIAHEDQKKITFTCPFRNSHKDACLLGCTMHLQRSNIVCSVYFLTWWKDSSRCAWTISPSLEILSRNAFTISVWF